MTTQTEAERLADALEAIHYHNADSLLAMNVIRQAAAELLRQASFNKELIDEVARLNKAVADAIAEEREACANVVEQTAWSDWFRTDCAAAIRARGNT